MSPPTRVVVAGVGPWSREAFEVYGPGTSTWTFVSTPKALTRELKRLRPAYVFLLHWRTRVEPRVYEEVATVGFHMTDLPKGRGGSPLQHLILAGKRSTVLTAFRVGAEWDAGPVYARQPLLIEGTARDVYLRSAKLAMMMARRIVAEHTVPQPQVGAATHTRRRAPADSLVPFSSALTGVRLFDFVRMLDADGYPHAFHEAPGWRLTFTEAERRNDEVVATVRFTRLPRQRKEES